MSDQKVGTASVFVVHSQIVQKDRIGIYHISVFQAEVVALIDRIKDAEMDFVEAENDVVVVAVMDHMEAYKWMDREDGAEVKGRLDVVVAVVLEVMNIMISAGIDHVAALYMMGGIMVLDVMDHIVVHALQGYTVVSDEMDHMKDAAFEDRVSVKDHNAVSAATDQTVDAAFEDTVSVTDHKAVFALRSYNAVLDAKDHKVVLDAKDHVVAYEDHTSAALKDHGVSSPRAAVSALLVVVVQDERI